MTAMLARPQLDYDNPWPGLESFQESERDFFFGRHREAAALLQHVLDSNVTVLYGRSGLGKTSLLRAGLFPLLREQHILPEHHFLPVYVRFELKPGAPPLARQLHDAVSARIATELPGAPVPPESESLWEYLHRKDIQLRSASGDRLTPVIVLDQFEELFTLGERAPELVEAFRNDLGDLAENRIPATLSARIDADDAVAARFDLRSRNYKLIVSLREDFLPDLEEWCRLIPALGRARLRLLPLSRKEAFGAVHQPAKDLMTAALARRVVDIVAGENLYRDGDSVIDESESNDGGHAARYLEPALLSLFCHELNEERKRLGQERFDEQLIEGAKSGILSNFYATCVHGLPHVAKFIEDQLITEKGFRNSYAREDAVPAVLTEEELNGLIGMRLLRVVEYHGAQRIELTHDVLTKVVREHRDERRAGSEKQALAETSAELARQRRIGRGLRWLSIVLALVSVLAIVLGVLAVVSARSAEKARDETVVRTSAERLYAQSLLMQAGLSDEGSDDTDIMQRVLAARAITPGGQDRMYELLTIVNAERDLLKINDVPSAAGKIALSADGTRVATIDDEDVLRLSDTASGREDGVPQDVAPDNNNIWTSPDGSRIAFSDGEGIVRVVDAVTKAPVGRPFHADGWISCVAFNRDDTRIAIGDGNGNARVWDTMTGQPAGTPLQSGGYWVSTLAFSPDGARVAFGDGDGNIRLWEASTGRPLGPPLRGHEGAVMSLAFSPDGKLLASGGDKVVKLWDAVNLREIGVLNGHDGSILSLAFAPDSSRLASGSSDSTVRLWDVATRAEVGVFRGHEDWVRSVAFSGDGARLVSASDDETVRVWDASTWQPLRGHDDDVDGARFSDDGRLIFSGGSDGTVRTWNVLTGKQIGPPQRVPEPGVTKLIPISEDRLLSIAKVDQTSTMRLWDAHTLAPMGEGLPLPARWFMNWIEKPGRIAVTFGDRSVQLFSTETLKPIGQSLRMASEPTWFDLSRDGRAVAIGGEDGAVQLRDSGTGSIIGKAMTRAGTAVTTISFDPVGSNLAVGYADGSLQLWDTHTFRPIGDPMHPASVPTVLLFSPDGRTLVSGSVDGTIRLWDAATQTLSAVFKGHESNVTSLSFSSDGRKLLSASDDNTLHLWPTPASAEEAQGALCAKLTHNMSRDKWNDVVSSEIPYRRVCDILPEG